MRCEEVRKNHLVTDWVTPFRQSIPAATCFNRTFSGMLSHQLDRPARFSRIPLIDQYLRFANLCVSGRGAHALQNATRYIPSDPGRFFKTVDLDRSDAKNRELLQWWLLRAWTGSWLSPYGEMSA